MSLAYHGEMEASNDKSIKAPTAGRWRRFRDRLISLKDLLWFRISVCFIIGATFPLIVFAAFTTWHTGNTIYEQTTSFSTELVGEVSRNIQREIDSLQINSVSIAYNDVVQYLAVNYSEMSYSEQQAALSEARFSIARQLTFRGEVSDVLLYLGDEDGVYLYGNFAFPFRLSPEYETKMIERARELTGRLALIAYGPGHQISGLRLAQDIVNNTAECLMAVRAIRSLSDGHTLGVLALRLDACFFNDALRDINIGEGVQFMAFDATGDTVLTTDEGLFTSGEPAPLEVLAQLEARDSELTYLDYAGRTYIIYDAQVDTAGWTVVLLVPRENLDNEIRSIIYTFLLILVLALLMSVLVINIFHRIFNRPMIRLVNAMNAADAGNLRVEVDNTSSDEVGQAARSFNNMLARIRDLLSDVKAEETAKHAAELAALQAQINPHFLSNTLGAARLMAQTHKAGNIDQLLAALIDLLHISMGGGSDLITLAEEVKYVQSYEKIMQYRSYTGPEVQYFIQEEAKDCLVPKLILQPLVENAFTHGVMGKGQFGQISVRAVTDGDGLSITVTDNGCGIPPEKIDTILNTPPADSGKRFSGIGLSNVHSRLQRLFGEGYGLSVDSIPNIFTTIEIFIPIIRAEGGDLDDKKFDTGDDS